ncbi:hypothetical protein PYW07_011387 [Mythimna separata]|uniref:P77 homologue n=1 Tax=Mythimna separata TaxID=271217 RepID=A0AAD7YA02_MYTSE|nr:hypothetical protein PYW07_011387 [Mythimna separata]
MLLIVYFVFLSSNFLFIKSEDSGIINIDVYRTVNCMINPAGFKFTEGQNVTLIVHPGEVHIDLGWWRLVKASGSSDLYDQLKGKNKGAFNYSRTVDKAVEGSWQFTFYFNKDNANIQELPRVLLDGTNYTMSVCTTNVTIVPPTTTTPSSSTAMVPLPKDKDKRYDMLVIIASVVAAVLIIIIIAQAAYILYLKNKAQKLITLNTHNNLSKKSESTSNDRARYCSNPGQKIMKEPILVEDDNRDSVIYEAPNIELSSNTRMPMQPPQPPAITTMPRTPRPDHNLKIGPQALLASALNSPARSPMSDTLPPNFQRPNQAEREMNLANRPPLPLPNHPPEPMFQELYEEMPTEENTYEPPPVINTMPPRLPVPPKKVPTGNLLDVKENTLKSRPGNKPPLTAKPTPQRPNMMTANEFEQALRRRNENSLPRGNPGHMMHQQQQEQTHRRRPPGDGATNELEEALRRRNNNGSSPSNTATNELEEALKRRNKVMQVPIVSIPEPSSARNSPKPKPPPAFKPPVKTPHPVQEEIYYNEASSDEEEWTYEPLKPLNSYDPNIYNV